jgi:hypothetical protein
VYVIVAVAFAVLGIGVLVVIAHQTKKSAARAIAINHMKQISLACHAFNDIFKQLPTPKHVPKDGEPVDLSWRVTILPYVEFNPLFMSFDQTTAWDSPTNKRLLDDVPSIFFDPQLRPELDTATHFQLFTGPGTLFPNSDKVTLESLPKGTFLFAEAAQAVPWTKPADMAIVPDAPLPLPPGTFLAARADGTVQAIDRTHVSDDAIRWYLRPNDGPAPPLE